MKRRGFRIRKKSSSQSESGGSPPSPKLFNSLEHLSLSVESSDLPGSSSSQRQGNDIPTHGRGEGSGCGAQILPCPGTPKISTGPGPVTQSSHHGPPKSPRRFSVLSPSTRRPSSSVPSSPKLGLSNISIPLWSPCKNLFHQGASSSNNSSNSQSVAQASSSGSSSGPGGGSTFVSRAGQGLGKLFGSSNSNSPTTSPSPRHRNVPVQSTDSSPLASPANISQQKRQIGGVR